METIIVAVVGFGILFGLLAVRMFFVKDGEFRGTCSTQNQALSSLHEIECGVCGRVVKPGECGNPEEKKLESTAAN